MAFLGRACGDFSSLRVLLSPFFCFFIFSVRASKKGELSFFFFSHEDILQILPFWSLIFRLHSGFLDVFNTILRLLTFVFPSRGARVTPSRALFFPPSPSGLTSKIFPRRLFPLPFLGKIKNIWFYPLTFSLLPVIMKYRKERVFSPFSGSFA